MYPLETLMDVGIKEYVMVTREDSIEEFEEILGDGRKMGIKIKYVIQDNPGGIGEVVKLAKDYLKDDSFIFHLGDNIFASGIHDQVNLFLSGDYDGLVTYKEVNVPKSELRRWGLVELRKDGTLKKYHEKPKNPPSNLAGAGLYIFKPEVFKYADEWTYSARNEIEISELYNIFIKHGANIGSYEINTWWNDPGKMIDLIEANRDILDRFSVFTDDDIEGKIDKDTEISGDVKIEKGTKVTNSVIRGPAVIGKNCVIENSYVGPFSSIYHNCEIKNSEVENSVLLEGAKIIDVNSRIDRSLLGKDAQILRHNHKPRSSKILLGDNSIVDLE